MSKGGSEIWRTEPKTDRRVRSMSMTGYALRNRKKERYTVSTECTDIRQKKRQVRERSRARGAPHLQDNTYGVIRTPPEPDAQHRARRGKRKAAGGSTGDLHKVEDMQELAQM